jgi:glutaredoxin
MEKFYEDILNQITTTPGLSKAGLLEALVGEAIPAQTGGEGNWGNLYIRPMEFPEAGYVVEGHAHKFDHVTFINQGSLIYCSCDPVAPVKCPYCEKDPACLACKGRGQVMPAPSYSQEVTYDEGNFLLIKAGRCHKFVSLGKARAYCVYSHRDPETGNVANNRNGWMPAYS